MSHRMTVTEAIAEAGGVLSTGDRSKVVVLRRSPSGVLSPIAVNVSAIYKGKAADTTYLVPGDQILVKFFHPRKLLHAIEARFRQGPPGSTHRTTQFAGGEKLAEARFLREDNVLSVRLMDRVIRMASERQS